MRRPKTVAYLTLEMMFPVGSADEPLGNKVLAYHRQIESRFSELASSEQVVELPSSSSEFDRSGKTYCTDEFSLSIQDSNIIDPVAEKIAKLVRDVEIKFKHEFRLKKQIVKENDRREIYSRRIHATRSGKWTRDVVETTLKSRPEKTTPFPPRLDYAAEMAGRCHGIGGNDVTVLFRDESDLEQFLTGLSSEDRNELVAIYQKIVRQKHNEWFLNRLKEHPEDRSEWINEFSWFLSVLDRLRQGGLMGKTRGKAKKTVLCYWDDYLCGEPYMED